MRILPLYFGLTADLFLSENRTDYLPAFREAILGIVACRNPTKSLLAVASNHSTHEVRIGGSLPSRLKAAAISMDALSATFGTAANLSIKLFQLPREWSAIDTVNLTLQALVDAPISKEDLLSEVFLDCNNISVGKDVAALPLWSIPHPDWHTDADREGRAIWAKEPEVWDFWVRWWDGVIAGKPLPWELQEKVALIPDEDLQKGPAHIAEVIRGIEELFELRQMAKEIKAEFPRAVLAQTTSATLEQRSHNHPPEMVETPQELLSSLSQIWAEVDAADRELAKTAPDRAVLRAVGKRLLQWTAAIAKYCVGLVDAAVQSTAKAFGPILATTILGYAASPLLQKFIEKLGGL